MSVNNRRKEVEEVGEDGEGSHKEGEDGERLQLVWQALDGKPREVQLMYIDWITITQKSYLRIRSVRTAVRRQEK